MSQLLLLKRKLPTYSFPTKAQRQVRVVLGWQLASVVRLVGIRREEPDLTPELGGQSRFPFHSKLAAVGSKARNCLSCQAVMMATPEFQTWKQAWMTKFVSIGLEFQTSRRESRLRKLRLLICRLGMLTVNISSKSRKIS